MNNPLRHFIKRDRYGRDALWHGNIESQTINNQNYRKVVSTNKKAQLVLMSLKPKESIGTESHPVDQFFRIEQGTALFTINGRDKYTAGPSDAILIPSGTKHNVTNMGKNPVKLYSIYSPPNHPPNTIQKVRPKMDTHSKSYRGGNAYTCGRCGADFPTYKLLQIHLSTH